MPSVNRVTRGNNPDSSNGRILLHGTYIGFVKDNNDPQMMGRLQVFIPELGGDPAEPKDWLTVGYASPFAGSTSPYDLKKGDKTMAGSQSSYGMWCVPPHLENQVLVQFVNGDTARGFWTACVWQQNMNQMVPGIASSSTSDPSYSGAQPTVEYNKRDETTPSSPNRAVFTPLADGLKAQGLQGDKIRGPATSSARRNGVSHVYGFLSPRGHQQYTDDDADNEFIRMRTRSGVQILIHETTGMVYINSKTGNSWLEISDAGIDVYSKNSISLRAEKDFNLRADNNIILDAGGSIFMRAGSDLNIQTGGQIVAGATGNITLSTQANTYLTVNGNFLTYVVGNKGSQTVGIDSTLAGTINIQSNNDITSLASGNDIRQAASIQDNPGSAPSAAVLKPVYAQVPTPTTAPDIQNGAAATIKTIVNRLPTHEPWAGHPSPAATGASSSSGSSSGGSGGSGGSSSKGSSGGGSNGGSSGGSSGGGASSGGSTSGGSTSGGSTSNANKTGGAGITNVAATGPTAGVKGLPANVSTVVAQFSGKSTGRGECVDLVRAATGLGNTRTWRQGDAVTTDNVNEITPGTPIAIFQNGTYNNIKDGTGRSHAAIFLGPGTTPGGQPGIKVLDQWSGRNASVRVLPWGASNKLPCDNGSSFNIINTTTPLANVENA